MTDVTDATSHFEGKHLFTKLDCHQGYHCVQLADALCVHILGYNFASCFYGFCAYPILAQGFRNSKTGVSAFVIKYLYASSAASH